jgi:hypothetical protein
MDFRPLAEAERRRLLSALCDNAEQDRAILMDRRDTSFIVETDDVADEEVIACIQWVPATTNGRWFAERIWYHDSTKEQYSG